MFPKVALLIVVMAGWLASNAENWPVKVVNPNHQSWPEQYAEQLYYHACRRVAEEVNPSHPLSLRPSIEVRLGEKDEVRVIFQKDHTVIMMKKWNAEVFSIGVIHAALIELIPNDRRIALAKSNWTISPVPVEELQASRR